MTAPVSTLRAHMLDASADKKALKASLELSVPGPKHSVQRKGRRYIANDGGTPIELVSVTTILQRLSKGGLVGGAKKVVANTACDRLAELAEMERDAAYKLLFHSVEKAWGKKRDLGTAVHEAIDAWLKAGTGEPTDVENIDLLPYLAGASRFLDDHVAEVISTELTVVNTEHRYAGTLDLLARTRSGKVAVIDFKTGSSVWAETALQLVAYANCTQQLTDMGGLEPQPHTPDIGIVVHLPGDATYNAHPVEFTDLDWQAFAALRDVQEWVDKREKTALGKPRKPHNQKETK